MSASIAPTLLTARWLATMTGPLQRDGGVLFEAGLIRAVGSADVLRNEHPGATVVDAGEATILPGLVNAHTHLELSDATPGTPPAGGFAVWLLERVRYSAAPLSAEQIRARTIAAVQKGVEQSLRFGVTSVGDISRLSAVTRPVLAEMPLNAVSFGEVTAMASRRGGLEERLAEALLDTAACDHLHVGLSPHAPYSIEPASIGRCLAAAAARNLPLTVHLAESPDEATFLADHAGPLRELWNSLGWDDAVPRFAGGPIRLADALGLLAYPRTLLAHVNYCDDAEMQLLAAGRASVVFCPRTHAFFGHPPHRWRDMLAAGINVAVGTDSCASSPDLNLVDELRLLHRLAPEVPPRMLWELATTRAAGALGLQKRCGRLAPGLRADAAVFPSVGDDPLREILASRVLPQTWCGGVGV